MNITQEFDKAELHLQQAAILTIQAMQFQAGYAGLTQQELEALAGELFERLQNNVVSFLQLKSAEFDQTEPYLPH